MTSITGEVTPPTGLFTLDLDVIVVLGTVLAGSEVYDANWSSSADGLVLLRERECIIPGSLCF